MSIIELPNQFKNLQELLQKTEIDKYESHC